MRCQRSGRTLLMDWSPHPICPSWRCTPILGSPPCPQGRSFPAVSYGPCHSSSPLCLRTGTPSAPSCWPPSGRPKSNRDLCDLLQACIGGSLHEDTIRIGLASALDG